MRMKLSVCLLSLLCLSSLSLTAAGPHKIWFNRPNAVPDGPVWHGVANLKSAGFGGANADRDWEDKSLPLGNGSIAANIIGSIGTERFTFNEKTLWRGGPNTTKKVADYWKANKSSAHLLKDIRQAFTDGDLKKAAQLTRDNFNGYFSYSADGEDPYRFGSFTTAGEFRIHTPLDEKKAKHYARSLSLDSALATVQFDYEQVPYKREFFVSYPDNMMVVRFSAGKKGQQDLCLSYQPNPLSTGSFKKDGKNGLVYIARLDDNQMQYAVRFKAIATGGEVKVDKKGEISIHCADEVMFLITADTDYKMNFDPDFNDPKTYVGEEPVKTTAAWMEKAGAQSYDQLLQTHYNDYAALYGRTTLELNPSWQTQHAAVEALPTPERLARYRTGAPDYGLETLYYQFGRYLLIASSRPGNMPANLQGIWHNNVDGPWHMDYHNNINIQMNYWPAAPANLAECTMPLFDFIRTLVKPGEKTAQAYFGAPGWTASISGNIFGFTSPMVDKDMSWNFSPVAGPWLATHVWEYYDYTRDIDFLRQTGYDLIKSSADFAVGYLWHKPDGTYTAAPSTSPEHGPIDEGATFSHGVIREILLDAIAASEVLDKDADKRAEWKEVLEHIAPYKIGRYGQLMEWSADIDDPYDAHRHVNHLFGLHPGRTISPVTTPKMAKAARVVLEHRGDGATGWSMGWKLNQWARLHDGDRAYRLYGNLLKNGTNNNLWDTHPPFQIDGNFGGAAGVMEMLLQSHMGFIHLLPALPGVWHDGVLKGVRAKGNFTVELYWKDNNLVKAVIHSGSGVPCNIHYQKQQLSFDTEKGRTYTVVSEQGKLKCI